MSQRGRKKRTITKKYLLEMVEVGFDEEPIGRIYDIVNLTAIVINLLVSILMTFENLNAKYSGLFLTVEAITVFFFAVDYLLRVYTAPELYPNFRSGKAVLRYVLSLAGIVDLLSFLPYYLPIFFPAGAVAFRLFRIMRIFRLFRINAYYDSLNVITAVIISKGKQLLSSIFVVLILMVASSLCMYGVEHEAQPEVFSNALSGIWWAASTLLTVGYGDIYPITPIGQVLGVIIAFLGVFVVAIPTGIISAGFVEQYTRLKQLGDERAESELRFLRIPLREKDPWIGLKIRDLRLSRSMIVALVIRNGEIVMPSGDEVLQKDDIVVIGAEPFRDKSAVTLKEVSLKKEHPWVGQEIRDLDISRQTFIVMVRRKGEILIPRGDLRLREGDVVVVYSRIRVANTRAIHI